MYAPVVDAVAEPVTDRVVAVIDADLDIGVEIREWPPYGLEALVVLKTSLGAEVVALFEAEGGSGAFVASVSGCMACILVLFEAILIR
jgi:hypothetical protein